MYRFFTVNYELDCDTLPSRRQLRKCLLNHRLLSYMVIDIYVSLFKI